MSLISRLIAERLRRVSDRMLRFGANAAPLNPPKPHAARRDLLYVHVPFCESLCPFCPFHRVLLDERLATQYFLQLRTELRRYHERGFHFGAVYVGGGTPTILPDELIETLELIRALFGVTEISVETNPNHLVPNVLARLRQAGVDRLSVGVQSFDDDLLREIGRYEAYGSSAQIREHLGAAMGQFKTLNVDMIFNFPHQALASVESDIDVLQELGVDQVSFYPLMPTGSQSHVAAPSFGEVEFAREPEFYRLILERMRETHAPSSVWCFSRVPSMIDEYIANEDNYIGVGSGAFSYIDGAFYSTTFSIPDYLRRIESGVTGIVWGTQFGLKEQMRYDFLVRLFGLNLDGRWMAHKYGHAWRRALFEELLAFRLIGALARDGDDYRLRRRGMYYWLVMMREFLSSVDRFRDAMRANVVAANVSHDGGPLAAPRTSR